MQGNTFKIPTARPATTSQTARRSHAPAVGFAIPCVSLLVLAYLSSANAAIHTQLLLSAGLLLALFITRFFGGAGLARMTFLAITTFIILRYFFWRTLYTVEYTEWISFTCAVILYLAELYGIIVALVGNFVNVAPMERETVPLPTTGVLPSVDVFIPTYNESQDLLETTVMGAIQMRYPEGRMKIYLLDDGGTDQKCESGSEASMLAARLRRSKLQELCAELGVTYLTRHKNIAAKAGNLNEAIRKTDGDLVVVFDADHVPTTDFLEKTVGFFLEDPKLFLVQTPHFFINPDPIEKNLNTFRRMPSENEMFYQVIQKGLDFWNSSFFCGSGALMRRRCLETIGGISSATITEDAETALALHAKGYNSAYISTPLLSGLAPDTMSAFITQRSRWAQGMTQIFLLKCPLFLRGLTFPQRLCYSNSCFFWVFPFVRLIYMLAPAAFLVFGLRIYAANIETFCVYSIPYIITMFVGSNYLYGKARWAFISELYELIQSIHTIPAILATVLSPRSPIFKVTPKQERLSEDFISPVAGPFYLLAIVNFFCLGMGAYSLLKGSPQIYPLSITMFWSLFNTVILMAVLGALFERRQRRSTPRVDAGITAELIVEGQTVPCHVEDLSLGGCKLAIAWGSEGALENTSSGILRVLLPRDEKPLDFHVVFRNFRDGIGADFGIGVQFVHTSLQEKLDKVRLVTGDSMRWAEIQKSRESNLGVISAFISLIGIGFTGFLPHLFQMWADFFGLPIRSRERNVEQGPVNV